MIHGDACFPYFNKIWGIPAIVAGARYSALPETNIMAYDGYNLVPQVDFSGLGDLPKVSEAAAAQRRQRDLQNSMIVSAMSGCMARNGYIVQR
jgi:hypothetical protein